MKKKDNWTGKKCTSLCKQNKYFIISIIFLYVNFPNRTASGEKSSFLINPEDLLPLHHKTRNKINSEAKIFLVCTWSWVFPLPLHTSPHLAIQNLAYLGEQNEWENFVFTMLYLEISILWMYMSTLESVSWTV